MATPNRNSSPTYCWATPFTRLRKENSFGKFVKVYHKILQKVSVPVEPTGVSKLQELIFKNKL
ncbi:hypothetical protein FA950_29500 [Bacillus thuringiensis]|nr:hypothetical protein FA950_29500 [Bacillus thuringiensis]